MNWVDYIVTTMKDPEAIVIVARHNESGFYAEAFVLGNRLGEITSLEFKVAGPEIPIVNQAV